MDDNIATFNAITGASPDVARSFLEMTAGNFERAIELFYENPDLASGVGAGLSANTAQTTNPVPAVPSNIGRQDAAGVIHIDSDEDEDMQFDDDSDVDVDNDRAVAAQAAAIAQEEEDMAMAKRLQEELYQENNGGSGSAAGAGLDPDDVRAPIARTTETLVAPGPSWGDGDGGDVEAALLEQLRRRQQQQPRSGGPFSQQIWGDPERHPAQSAENGAHARRLEDLFRPPYDIMARMTWDEARSLGKEDKKWILVNLQDMNDFNCQALNRDIWKDKNVKELVSENFIFLQYDKDFPDAEAYITFYFPNQAHENPDNYPHVSIIDPRTGEQVKVWSGRPFPSATNFHAELAEFLDRYSLAANSKNPVATSTARKPQVVDVERMTEDEMLEMALKNSLESAANRGSSTPNVHDPDALTKADDSAEEPEAKGKEPEQSAFAQISGTSPHVEPENDPATTTRIQFRHPNGRVIRRFSLQDPVRQIYEWLKAEPLEGKEGIEFELKKMPQGQDLIENLGQSIADTGLKQGTVMIEFIED
ncbi:UBX domain protein Ubx2 [Neonectria punicea]|uniref:UBX domain protein Ubx2 n=1 Tax=Neonectria punicea TaxID=979145 RepID=A0ABR1GYG3_9HYPO